MFINRVEKSKKMKRAEHALRMGGIKNIYNILGGKPEENCLA
jgi:hypothetical protein